MDSEVYNLIKCQMGEGVLFKVVKILKEYKNSYVEQVYSDLVIVKVREGVIVSVDECARTSIANTLYLKTEEA